MDAEQAVVASLRKAVAALPDDVALRFHLAEVLVAAGHRDEAVGHLGAILQADPSNAAALSLLIRQQAASPATAEPAGFDWAEAEAELGDVLPPMFVAPDGATPDSATPDGSDGESTRAFDAEHPGLKLAH